MINLPLEEVNATLPPSREWVFYETSEEKILFLQQKYGVNDITARLALHRMRSLEEGDEIFFPFLKHHMPDPSFLPDCEKACEHVLMHMHEKWGVWADYDVDGACSGALLVRYFQALNISMEPYVPDRFREGYGPNIQGIQALWDRGIRHLFVVDCGSTSLEPLAYATQKGMHVIIIDHHRVGNIYPEVHAFINPKRPDAEGPLMLQTLCAGGLVFLFLVALNRHLRWKNFFNDTLKEPNLFSFLDLVALSTICDMMPLRHLNRAFVTQGLKMMQLRENVGLNALIEACGIRETLSPIHLGYSVGPRINAGGRVGDSTLGVKLLSCDNAAQATEMAGMLNTLNYERQQIERDILEKAVAMAIPQKDDPYILVYGENWHEGVLGIIASHLKENFFKPAFVLTQKGEILKGSVRSVPGIDIGDMIHHACEEKILITGGGHPMAGGLALSIHNLNIFKNFLHHFFMLHRAQAPSPPLWIDMKVTFEQLRSPEFLHSLLHLGPFGADYPLPKFLIENIRLERIVTFGYNHLRMYGIQPNGHYYSMVFFRQADKKMGTWLLSHPKRTVDCVFTPQIDNRWGVPKIMIVLEDMR